MAAPGLESPRRPGAVLVRDSQACIPLNTILSEGDLLYLITPAAVPVDSHKPPSNAPEDPFEALGRALARHHPWIRHVPYIARNGITDYHRAHIKLAKAVIFVVSGPQRGGQRSQVELSEVARLHGGDRPQIVLACCSLRELGPVEDKFPTVIEIAGYTRDELESAADVLFGRGIRMEPSSSNAGRTAIQDLLMEQRRWSVEEWHPRDIQATHELWCECLPASFHLERFQLQLLLSRPGFARHFVVRDPATREVVGFCATYTSFIGKGEGRLGSLSTILVKPEYRRRGIGLSLHIYAMEQLRLHKASRLQLGSTFPRLLYGLPLELTSAQEWFKRRGWCVDQDLPGSGMEACDWVLRLDEWNSEGLSSSGLTFRPCEFDEFDKVLDFVARETATNEHMGWYDQYRVLAGTIHIQDIVIGLENGGIVATTITYTPQNGSRVANDLPWARTIPGDVGGVTCICITDDNLSPNNTRDSVMIRLLDACVKIFREQSRQKMFLDAVKGGYEGFQSLGFQKWARYRDVWRDVPRDEAFLSH